MIDFFCHLASKVVLSYQKICHLFLMTLCKSSAGPREGRCKEAYKDPVQEAFLVEGKI